ncbi:MAG: hypothetical protein ACRDUY_00040, partial [Nitriliruptorales bacterium]
MDLPAQEVDGLDGESQDLTRAEAGPRPEHDQALEIQRRGGRERPHLLRRQGEPETPEGPG